MSPSWMQAASTLLASLSSWDNRKINLFSLSNSTKEGYFSSIFWKTISLLVYMAQATRKLHSFSIQHSHLGQVLNDLSILCLFLLPYSTISLWSEVRSLLNATSARTSMFVVDRFRPRIRLMYWLRTFPISLDSHFMLSWLRLGVGCMR